MLNRTKYLDQVARATADVNQGRFAEAERSLMDVLGAAPTLAEAWFALGMCYGKQGRIADGTAALGKAAASAPGNFEIVSAYGYALKMSGQTSAAREQLLRAAALNPRDASVHGALGALLLSTGEADAAVTSLRAAVAAAPDHNAHRLNLAVALATRQDDASGEESAAMLAQLIADAPDFGEAHLNLGNILQRRGDLDGALTCYQRALAAGAEKSKVFYNLSTLYGTKCDYDAAFTYLDKAIALDPDYAEARFNRSLLYLMSGQWEKGWLEYEWRWRSPGFRGGIRTVSQPRWRGDRVDGKVLIWGEQGIGDEILFAGSIRDLHRSGHRLLWEIEPRLLPLVQRAIPDMQLVARRTPPALVTESSEIVAQLPAGSAGTYARKSWNDFNGEWSPVLKADPSKTEVLRGKIDAKSGQPVIGLSWISTSQAVGPAKSISLADLAPLFSSCTARWIDLQYGDTQRERSALTAARGVTLFHDPEIDLKRDIESVAALISLCDLVVTVSNTTAHIAAALGARVCVMVPAGNAKLWYWGEAGTASPWYPTAEILRQATPGDWSAPLAAVVQRLKDMAHG